VSQSPPDLSDPLSTDRKVAEHFDAIAGGYADNYANDSFFSYYFQRRLKIVFNFLKNYDRATVLDVGCGPGMMAKYSLERGFDFYGIDISEKMIDACIDRFGSTNSTHFSVGKIQELKFPDAFFDVVLCMGALEYIDRAELDGAIAEIARVLKPNGQIIISLMYKQSFFAWSRRLKNSIKAKITGRTYNSESYDGLSRTFDPKAFQTSLHTHQLANEIEIEFFGLNILPSFLEERLPDKFKIMVSQGLENIVKGRLKWLYMAFIVKARKKHSGQ
jgi:ubiquinone/menaquinone biosynthesis C-methylase UbiE